MKRIAIIGAGGHGRVVASALNAAIAAGDTSIFAGFIDGRSDTDNVIGTDADIPSLIASGRIGSFIIGIGSVRGGDAKRANIFAEMRTRGLSPATVIHPSAILADDVTVGAGTVIMAGAILNTGVRVGDNAIINTGAILDHDSKIGDHAHIAPGVTCSGNVSVGVGSLIGVGSTARQGVRIGDNATIGAGAVIVSDMPQGCTAYGNPAKPR